MPFPETPYEYLVRKTVTVSPDFSFVYDSVHYSMRRKYLGKQLEIRVGEKKIYAYNSNGDLVRAHDRSYTPKSWVVISDDMPEEYSDYSYWNTPYFLSKAGNIGSNTRSMIQRVIERFDYPVQSYSSCFDILRFAEQYKNNALENCCRDAYYGPQQSDLRHKTAKFRLLTVIIIQNKTPTGRYNDRINKVYLSRSMLLSLYLEGGSA